MSWHSAIYAVYRHVVLSCNVVPGAKYIYVKYALFFGIVFSGGRVFFLRFRLRDKQVGRRYITTHVQIPAELHGSCSEHSNSLSWLFRQWVAFRFAKREGAWNTPTFFAFLNRALRSHIVLIARSALQPAIQHHQFIFFHPLCRLLRQQQQQQQHSSVTATDGASVCMCERSLCGHRRT